MLKIVIRQGLVWRWLDLVIQGLGGGRRGRGLAGGEEPVGGGAPAQLRGRGQGRVCCPLGGATGAGLRVEAPVEMPIGRNDSQHNPRPIQNIQKFEKKK